MPSTNDSIFWIEVDKIRPNPYQPRREFNEDRLRELADSIRQYGVLQPLVVTRHEDELPEGGLAVTYELIAGERRWRASQLAGISQVPAVIRHGEESNKLKLELAIIENLQREDLNPVDRAKAFHQLINEFSLKHHEVAKRVGRSREFVSNSVRILGLSEDILAAMVAGQITEGHSKPMLMLIDHPAEQANLFKEIIQKRLTVREAEAIARRIAFERVRKKERFIDPDIIEMENRLTETLGARVQIEQRQVGGKLVIEFVSTDDLRRTLELLTETTISGALNIPEAGSSIAVSVNPTEAHEALEKAPEAIDEATLYSIKNFSI